MRGGSLVIEPAVPPTPPRPRRPWRCVGSELLGPEERYNLLLALVYRAVEEMGRDVGMFQSFLQSPPPGLEEAYAGV